MADRSLTFVIPGDLRTRTGGYGYDREIIAGLRTAGWAVEVVSLPGEYPFPTLDEQEKAAAAFSALPDGARVLVDGLAFGVLPDVAARERERLSLIALVHHPLGLETGLDPFVSQLLLAAERDALACARAVIVTSRRTVEAVVDLGVPAPSIAVVEPGTAPAAIAAGSGGGPLHLLCVASITPRKGHLTLLEALEQVCHHEWRLTCVGSLDRDAAYGRGVAQRLASRPLAGRVTLAGELAGAPLDALYDTADLFVLPTHYEGYGMVVAEALARALPVVSTPTGAIADLVGDAAGVLVAPGDATALAAALDRLLSDTGELERLRRGAERVRQSLPTWADASARMGDALLRVAR
ncbi:MAG: glycosyltransferase family 4 protein [Vicinamibacterales bacterium]